MHNEIRTHIDSLEDCQFTINLYANYTIFILFIIISGNKPNKIVKNKKGNKQKNSILVKSLKSVIDVVLIFPNNILFNNHKEYPTPKTIPEAQKIEAQLLINKHPAIIKNSPTKLLVPGNPIFAIVKTVKNVEKSGIVVCKPL